MKIRYCLLITAIISGLLQAGENDSSTIIHVGDASFKDKPVFCEEDIVEPDRNDFQVLDYNVMSSEDGHRYSLVTIKNTSSGQRILTEDNLVAIYANCFSQKPLPFRQKFSGREVITKSIDFGSHPFPIIKIISEAI